MKKVKVAHGIHKFCKDALKRMAKHIPIWGTNNYRKMHGKPLRRQEITIYG